MMKFLKKVFDFYVNASIHVALAVYAFVRITEVYFNLPYNEPLNYFIFYGTITGYNFVKYAGVAKLHHRSLAKQLKMIQLFSLVCFLLMCFYMCKLSVETLLFFIPLVLVTFLYAVPFLSGFQKNLRSVSYLKIIIVALVWAGVTVLLPILDVKEELTVKVGLLAFQRFLLTIVLILPFDIRDMKYDAVSLQTIPKKIGVKNTKKLGVLFLFLCLLIEFVVGVAFFNVFFIMIILMLILVWNASEKQQKYYSSFWVEAIPILWMFLLFLL